MEPTASSIKQLKFSHNWNSKLSCAFFTSLRLSGRFDIGDEVEILFKVVPFKKVTVRGKKKLKLKDINPFIAGLDTGYSMEETCNILRKMYPETDWDTQEIYLYLFETLKS